MKTFYSTLLCIALGLLSPQAVWAAPDPSPDPNASVVYLRTSCHIANSDPGESPMENCFESMTALKPWIYGRANPSAKLLIDIGPGQWSFSCNLGDSPGNVGGELTFRGAGVDKTVFGAGPGSGVWSGVSHAHCAGSKWAFESLTIKGIYAVVWFGRGESTWTNVVFEGGNAAWYDASGISGAACANGSQGTHRFFSSRFSVASSGGGFAFLNHCGDNWFWGSEILFTPSPGQSGAAIVSGGAGNRMHLYGSNVRAEAHANAGATGSLGAINVSDSGELHAHGVGIDVIGKAGWTLTALSAATGGEIHANESSYFIRPSSGATIHRIANSGGHVHAPYQWEPHPTPPAIQSETGADTTVVTGGTSDSHPHMLVYDNSCASKWYDMVDKACRP